MVGFNDATGRTAAEVVAMFHGAAGWVPGPRCGCSGRRMVPDPEHPYDVDRDDPIDHDITARVYVCRDCGVTEHVEVIDPDDRLLVRMLYRQWVQQQPHDGDPHIAGTSHDCDTCERYCFCDLATCVLHSIDEELSWASWHVPGDPTFGVAAGAAAGAALGGAE